MKQQKLPTIKEYMEKTKAKRSRKRSHGAQNAKISRLAGTLTTKEFMTMPKLKEKARNVLHERVRMEGKRKTGGWCEKCQVNLIYSANHILPTGNYPGVAFDRDNLFAGCASCNQSELFNRIEHNDYWEKILGREKMDTMKKRGKEHRYSREELHEIMDGKV